MRRGKSLFATWMAACMLLSLLPAAAFASDTSVVRRTEPLDLTGPVTYVNTSGGTVTKNAAKTDITDSAEGWSWDSDSNTLTLSGAQIEVTQADPNDTWTAGIELPYSATIELAGDTVSTVQVADHPGMDASSCGIYAGAGLTIAGSGALHTGAGAADKESCGLYTPSNLIITGSADVTAQGGAAPNSYGIYASNDHRGTATQITGSATVYAAGGNAQSSSYGLYGHSGLTISGSAAVTADGGEATYSYGIYGYSANPVSITEQASVIASAGDAEKNSYGIYAKELLSIDTSAQVTATGGAVTQSSSNLEGSFGMFAYLDLTISGGTVTATAGAARDSSGRSTGIRTFTGAVTVTDSAAVTARGGEAGGASTGLNSGREFSASGVGTSVTAEGGTAGKSSQGIYAREITITDATVQASGGTAGGANGDSRGIRAQGDPSTPSLFLIAGSAQVTATSGDATSSSTGLESFTDPLQITGTAQVTATGGHANTSTGISLGTNSSQNDFTLSDSVQVTATAGDAAENSYGVFANRNVTVSQDATLTAAGGDSGVDSYGIYLERSDGVVSLSDSDSAAITATGGSAANGNSSGICGSTALTGGRLTARGEREQSASGYGIETPSFNSTISISGTRIQVQGKTDAMQKTPQHTGGVLLGRSAQKDGLQVVTGNVAGYWYLETRPAVQAVAVSPSTATVATGGTSSFTATTTFQDNSTSADSGLVLWSVTGALDKATAIGDNGTLTVAPGETAKTLTVSAQSRANTEISASAVVTVTVVPPTVQKVTVSPDTASVAPGGKQTFSATTVYQDGSTSADNTLVLWSVSGALDTATAIGSDGVLTVTPGETAKTLTVTAQSRADDTISASAVVTVTAVPPVVKQVTLSPDTASVAPGGKQTFSATTVYQDGSTSADNTLVLWSVSGALDTATAIGSDGVLTVTPGETAKTLTVSAQSRANAEISASVVVTVSKPDPTPSPSGGSGGGGQTYYTISAQADPHGSLSPSGQVRVARGRDQTFLITPDAGYEVYGLLVDGKQVEPSQQYTFQNVRDKHTLQAQFVPSFTDVAEDAWYRQAVREITWRGYFQGTASGRFSPEMELSRAMLVTALYRAAGSPAPAGTTSQFADVAADSWYAPAVGWALAQGIVYGVTSDTFQPDAPITREQLVAILYRHAGSPQPQGDLSRFADADQAGTWANDALCWAAGRGLLSGRSGGLLAPQGHATRAEVAVILMQYLPKS